MFLTPGSNPVLSLTILKSYNEARSSLQKLNHLLGGLFVLAVLAGGLIVFVISDRFTKPLASLVEGVSALEQGNFEYPLEAQGGDEVAQVSQAPLIVAVQTLKRNETQRQQLEDQLRQSQ